ncbi:MAG: hypothetical protein ACO3Z6_15945 [Pseudomonadales bacterium]
MADTFARMRQIVGSTADWAANNIVLGSGEIGIERVSATDIRIKVGDGTSTWSALSYASASSTGINAATQTALNAKVAKAGDTMTGLLVLSGDAVAPLGAATKQQVDAVSAAATAAVNARLPIGGGTMTGALTLASDPSANLHAATKQYVDTQDAKKVDRASDTTAIGGSSTYADKIVRLNGAGVLDASLVPVTASYLGLIDLTVPYALGGTYTVGNYFAVSKTGTIDSSWNVHLNDIAAKTHGTPTPLALPTTVSAGQLLIRNSNNKWDLVGDTSASAAISGKVDKAGDTMTGPLVLAANPTAALEAATKQYADSKLDDTGGTMTGPLISAASTAANAGFSLPHGTAPTSPADGDVWTTSAGFFVRINGVTQQPALTGHTHTIANVTGLQAALDGKAPTSHTHTAAQISDSTTAGRTLLSAADAAAQRTALGLGALATAASVGTLQIADNAVTGAKIALGSDATGDIMYYNGSDWTRLAAGASLTPGQVLKTNGVAAPSWLTLGTGAVRNISVGTTAPISPAINDIWVDTN